MVDATPTKTGEYRLGVGILLLNREGEVLVGRRSDIESEAWQLPQGGIHEGETPREAVFRELKEEIGSASAEILAESAGWTEYDLPSELIGKTWNGRWRGQRQKWFVMLFTGEDSEIHLDAHEQELEFCDWKWIPIAALLDLVVPFKRKVYVDLLSEFSELAPRAQELSALLAEPIIRMTMAADGITGEDLYGLLRRVSYDLHPAV